MSVNTAFFVHSTVMTSSEAELDSDNTPVCHAKINTTICLGVLRYEGQSCLLLPPTMQEVSNTYAMRDSNNDRTASGQTSPLLKLPGELRNRIYRLTLASGPDSEVRIDEGDVPEPNLLLTCHEIRAEAISIYYGKNLFRTPIKNLDSTLLMKLTQLLDLRKRQ